MVKKYVCAIDLGTTGNRVIAFDRQGKAVAKAYYEHQQIYPRPGWVEHDPLEIWKTAECALKEVLDRVGAENVESIGITNQRETTVVWDKDTGRPVYNAIVWQCRRTQSFCDEVKGAERIIKDKTGLVLDPYFSGSKIQWILKNIPEADFLLKAGRLLFGTVDTWVLWMLTGRCVHATEYSNISRTLLFNIHTLDYDQELMDLFQVPGKILPQVMNSNAHFGNTAPEITGKSIPVVGILGDQQASLFAHCGWEEGIIKNTYGTGMFVMVGTRDRIVCSDTLLSTISWKLDDNIEYALEGSIFMGGATIQWLRDNLSVLERAEDSERMAARLDSNEGVYLVPAFQGMGAPHWNPDARGVILGLSRKSDKDVIVRAALESLAYQTRDVVDKMREMVDFDMRVLRVDGGASCNNFLMQFQADILSLRVERPEVIETTALGAAGISGITSGVWTKERFQADVAPTAVAFAPKQGREDCYRKWQHAVTLCQSWQLV